MPKAFVSQAKSNVWRNLAWRAFTAFQFVGDSSFCRRYFTQRREGAKKSAK